MSARRAVLNAVFSLGLLAMLFGTLGVLQGFLIPLGAIGTGLPVLLRTMPSPKPLTAKEAARGKPIEARQIGPDGKCSQSHSGDCAKIADWSDLCVQAPEDSSGPWCQCGSDAPNEPVEVGPATYGGDPYVVAYLCPGCREKRTPEQVRVADARQASEARAIKALATLDRVKYGDLTYEQAQAALRERMAVVEALTDAFATDAEGGTIITREQLDRFNAVVAEYEELKRWLDAHRPTGGQHGLFVSPGRTDAAVSLGTSAQPEAPVEIEQGGYIYSMHWWVEIEDVCEDADHEWEQIMTHGSRQALVELCTRCEVKRRPTLYTQNQPFGVRRIYRQPSPPDDVESGVVWEDTSDGGKRYIHDGQAWVAQTRRPEPDLPDPGRPPERFWGIP